MTNSFPDLRPHFPHMIWWHEPRAFGQLVGSDKDFDQNCWSITRDEAEILYRCVRPGDEWLVIGARLGWCSAHLAQAGADVVALEPEFDVEPFAERFAHNTADWQNILPLPLTSQEYFEFEDFGGGPRSTAPSQGFFIDGNHDSPCPLNDAMNCARYAAADASIVFHDAYGKPIRDGAVWLMHNGWKARWYDTACGMIVCWRGNFVPPDHGGAGGINWPEVRRQRAPEFLFERCS